MAEAVKSNIYTIIVLLLVLCLVALSIRKTIKNRKNGRRSCGCGCSDCPKSRGCGTKEDRE